ncbi:MAG: serine protein kinase RIO [Cellvibrionaceae bacterium]|nr:serine protein kinase RIO [Cellvibrionaceae bacterium]
MKIPKRLHPLVEDGIIDEVVRPLMSGKEAAVFIVRCGAQLRCAKVYKEAFKRSFKQAVTYQEGRKVRNTRRARAMAKGSKFGREQQETLWHNAEVDALYKLAAAGVRVPKPHGCFDGVLLMELISDGNGDVAPRLNDVALSAEQAREDYLLVIRDIVRMLCVGLVHGDLSEFNVLLDDYGPVIIDLPQAVDATANNHAERMFYRDVNNMTQYYGLYAPDLLDTHYDKEIWRLYEQGKLHPDITLTGQFERDEQAADVDGVIVEIKAALAEEQARQERLRNQDSDA